MSDLRQTFYRGLLLHDLKRVHFGISLRCTPAIAAIIFTGVLMHHTAATAIMCGGALTVGSGVYQRIGQSQIASMMLATIGVGSSAVIGTLAGLSSGVLIAVVALWGFMAVILSALGDAAQWIGQQCTIALLVAGSFPGTFDHALMRAGLVMAGGLLQIITVEILLRFSDINTELKGWGETLQEASAACHTLWNVLTNRPTSIQFALRVAIILAGAVMTERVLALPNGYWVGMTTLLLLRQKFYDTWHRSASRICGTLAGAGVVMLAVRVGMPPWAFALAIPITAFFCFAFQQFSYALFSFCLTAYIVLLLAYGGWQEQLVAHNRITGTVLGAAFAMAGHLHFPTRRSS